MLELAGSNPKLLILDCDGVLIRSEAANLEYYNILFRRFGRPEVSLDDRETFELLHTLSTPQVIKFFFPEELQLEVVRYAQTVEYSQVAHLIEPEPGWRELIGGLPRSVKTAVATNRGTSARSVLAGVGLYPELFETVVTVLDVENPKPHPEILLKTLDLCSEEADRAVYVGDSDLDERAANDANVPFIGFKRDSDNSICSPGELGVLWKNP